MTDTRQASRGQAAAARLPVLLVAVLAAFSAQQLLTPVLAPLSRQLEITEVQLGLVITTAAAVVALTSPLWGRAVDAWGPRLAMLGGLALATVGLVGFAAVSELVLADPDGTGAGAAEYAVLLATRGVLFGAGLAAVPVAALAAASVASDEAGRTRAVSLVGAAQALSLVLGPAAGGGLALVSLLLPVWVAPAVLLGVAVLVATAMSGRPVVPAGTGDGPARAGEPGPAASGPAARLTPWDSRVWPLLATGFGLFLSLGLVQFVLGFLVQDRLGLSDRATAGAVGGALFVTGLALVAVQGVLVPRLGWPPARLLRAGTPVALVALLVIAVAPSLPAIVAGLVLLAAGLGLAIPGYTAAPTLLARPEEQGRVAGWVSATNASTFVVGPTLGSALYGVASFVPALAGAGVATVVWGFLLFHPGLRRVWRATSQPGGTDTP